MDEEAKDLISNGIVFLLADGLVSLRLGLEGRRKEEEIEIQKRESRTGGASDRCCCRLNNECFLVYKKEGKRRSGWIKGGSDVMMTSNQEYNLYFMLHTSIF